MSDASLMGQVTRSDMATLIRQVRGPNLYNRQLISICQVNGLKSTGVKAVLQTRISDRESQLFSARLQIISPFIQHLALIFSPQPHFHLASTTALPLPPPSGVFKTSLALSAGILPFLNFQLTFRRYILRVHAHILAGVFHAS
jgi:hypothetical protein